MLWYGAREVTVGAGGRRQERTSTRASKSDGRTQLTGGAGWLAGCVVASSDWFFFSCWQQGTCRAEIRTVGGKASRMGRGEGAVWWAGGCRVRWYVGVVSGRSAGDARKCASPQLAVEVCWKAQEPTHTQRFALASVPVGR